MKDKHPKGIICLPDYKDCRKADKTECAKKFSFVLIPDPVSCHLHIHCKHTCYAMQNTSIEVVLGWNN